jgi:hypothetical protein
MTKQNEDMFVYRLNGDGAGCVGLHVNSILIWQRWQGWIVNNNLSSSILGQLLEHVVVLVEEQLHAQSYT